MAIITREVLFSDVSFYQGTINWDIMKTKSPAAIIRAGQNVWVDPQFRRNYSEAKRVGMKRGVYWFYDSRVHPDTQADIVISLIEKDLPEMEVFCDYERNYGGSYFSLPWAVRFMKRIETFLPTVKVGMYTGYYFFKGNTSPTINVAQYDYLKYKPLWLAWYTTSPSTVIIPAPWNKLTHWQWTSSGDGKSWGTESNGLDLNYYNGTAQEFTQKYSGVVVEPPPPPSNGGSMEEVLYTNGVKITNTLKHGYPARIIDIPLSSVRSATFWTWGDCRYVEQVDGDVVFNFSDYTDACKSRYGLRFNYANKVDWNTNAMPFLGWDDSNAPIISHPKAVFNSLKSAAQGYRYIIQNGVKNPAGIGNSSWDLREPRRLTGTRKDGSLVVISVCKENLNNVGITLHEACEIGIELDLDMLIDADSGSSVQDIVRFADGTSDAFIVDKRGAPPVYGIVKFHTGLVPQVITDPPPPPPPPPTSDWPEYVHLEKPDGTRSRYNKV